MGRLKPTLILGGPGCGKTTRLLDIVEQAFSRGVEPHKIAFVAFTRKAAQEARERMVEKFEVNIDDLPHFRTLHSFAFKHIDAQPAQILNDQKLRDYAKAEGLELSSEWIDEFGQSIAKPKTMDEQALSVDALCRLTGRSLEDVTMTVGASPIYIKKTIDDYRAFKEDAILYDFTDMLQVFVDRATVPDFDLLIVDEAQDLSWLQWQMVHKLVDHSKDVYFAGDDDQAIYAWAGADTEYFRTMDADIEVLPVSYRLKREVFDAAQKVIAYCDDRYPKDWQPHAEGGSVEYVDRLQVLDMSEGSWYLLARTNSLVRSFTKHMRDEGLAYWQPGKKGMQSSVDVPSVRSVLVYENLRQGKQFSGEDMRLVWHYIKGKLKPLSAPIFEPLLEYSLRDLQSTGFEASASWLDALDIPNGMVNYIRALRANGESLTKPPRITISTIHGVKGGEADNVVIWQKLSGRTFQSWVAHDDQEFRSLFTAMSRAKDRLIFLDAKTAKQYHVERMLR